MDVDRDAGLFQPTLQLDGIEPEQVPPLDVGATLQHVRGLIPADVTLTNPLHPSFGGSVRAEAAHRWNGDVWLVVVLPDGYPGRVPVGDTDLLGVRARPVTGTTVLSLEGIRRLHEIVTRLSVRGIRFGVQTRT